MKHVLFIGCWFLLLSVQAQVREVVIRGHVKNAELLPLEKATVTELGSQRTVFTNKDGSFVLRIPLSDLFMRVKYQGYKTHEKNYRLQSLRKLGTDTLLMEVTLSEKTEELETVDIQVQKIEKVYGRASILVLDYAFYKNGLLLLIKEKTNYKLRYVDENDQLVTELVLPFKYPRPKSLYKDCLDNYHVRTTDSVYQIFDLNAAWVLDQGLPAGFFDRTVVPCSASTDHALYMKSYGAYNQSITYSLIEKETGLYQILRNMKPRMNVKSAEEFKNKATTTIMALPDRMSGEIDSDMLKIYRSAQNDGWFFDRILTRPVYHPLFRHNDSIVIFDHFVDSAIVYNSFGENTSSHLITHHLTKGWANEIMDDVGDSIFYAKRIRNGIAYLLELDRNFVVIKEYKISSHIFPEHLQVHNGYAYYLYNTMDGVSVQNLYRQRLK